MTIQCWHPQCDQPANPDDAIVCQSCGRSLRLGDRYVIRQVIGQGGFGRTLLALDQGTAPPRLCVIKQNLYPPLANVPAAELSQRLQQEAERLRWLGQHPQIPALLDVFQQDGQEFLVQTYVAGKNLEQQLAQGCFSEAQIRQLLQEILPVLQFVHDHQLIHRDVKPANLITPADGSGVVLVDFGAAKSAVSPEPLDKPGTVIGSAAYVAPEQALGKAVFASDLYSLGVTCIHLLTGVHPFDLYSVTADCWQWQELVRPPASDALTKILDRMLARGLQQRYATAADILADLNRSPFWQRRPASAPLQAPRQPGSPVSPPQPQLLGTCRLSLPHPQTLVTALAISPDGRAIATGATDNSVRLWDGATGECLHTFAKRLGIWGQGHGDRIAGLGFSTDGRFLYSSSQDGDIRCWDLATYRLRDRLLSPGWQTTVSLLSPTGDLLISASGDGRIQLWDLAQRRLLHTLGLHQERVSGLAIRTDGKELYSGSWDATIRQWELPSGRLIQTLTASNRAITALAYAPLSQQIISGDKTGQVKVWTSHPPASGWPLTTQPGEITALATAPTRPWVAIGSPGGSLSLWDISTASAICELRHDWGIRQALFTPGGDRLVTASEDETVRVWTLQSQTDR